MAPRNDDDWSDSDDEDLSDIETNVQLGLPDGPLDSPEDLHTDLKHLGYRADSVPAQAQAEVLVGRLNERRCFVRG